MTTRRFPFKRPDGSLTVIIPQKRNRRVGESERTWIKRTVKKGHQEGEKQFGKCVLLPECDASDLPSIRFRNAWGADEAGKVYVRIIEARALRMIEIRMERNELLQLADGPALREMEQTPEINEWRDYKQALRDVPALIDLETIFTPEELEAFEPTWPKEPK